MAGSPVGVDDGVVTVLVVVVDVDVGVVVEVVVMTGGGTTIGAFWSWYK